MFCSPTSKDARKPAQPRGPQPIFVTHSFLTTDDPPHRVTLTLSSPFGFHPYPTWKLKITPKYSFWLDFYCSVEKCCICGRFPLFTESEIRVKPFPI